MTAVVESVGHSAQIKLTNQDVLENLAGWVPRALHTLSNYRGGAVPNGVWWEEDPIAIQAGLVHAFAEISHDDQPAHLESFNGGPPVAHGLLLLALVSRATIYQRLIHEDVDPAIEVRVGGGNFVFKAAVPIGRNVRIALCAQTWDMRTKLCNVTVGWRAVRDDDVVAAVGTLSILVTQRQKQRQNNP